MAWEDNPFLPRREIALLEKTLDARTLESRRRGRFCTGEGLVYPEFDERVHVIPPFAVPPEWQDAISIDPGLNNPLSAHWYCADWDGNVYVVAEHYEAGRDVEYHARRIREISRALGWHTDGQGRLRALIDSAANQRTLAASKSVSELFCERGILVNARVNKDLFAGIARVKQYLIGEGGKPQLYIFEGCVNLIREIKGYFWGEGDVPKKRDDHALDELRYYLMTKPRAQPPVAEPTAVQKDKARLLRRARRGAPL